MQAIVLAASGGPEFGPLCQGVSKGLLPFLGEPLLAHVIRYLEGQGASRIMITLREQPFLLEHYFATHPPARARLGFRLEAGRQGTASALKRLAAGSGQETLVVCMGDLITAVDLDRAFAFHKDRGALVTMVLVPGERAALAGRATVDAEGRLLTFEEGSSDAGRLASAGIYLIEREALVHAAGQEGDLGRDFFPALLARRLPIYGFVTDDYWMDAGQPAGYMRALADVLHGRVPGVTPPGDQLSSGVWVAPGAQVHAKARLVAPVFVGPAAVIEQEVQVGPLASVEGPSRLERGARLVACTVFPGTRVGKATRWESALLYPDGWLDLATWPALARASDNPSVLGTTYRPPLTTVLHAAFDQTAAAIGLLALAPVLLALAIAIKLDSPGPAFFTQLRVGQDPRPYRNGRPTGAVFEVFKFRTMRLDADAKVAELMAQNQYRGGAFFKLEHDPRITRLGQFLRKTSLDELPQLINVVRGEMRLVGNRPLPVYEAEALAEDWQHTRFLAPAGITGLWQISGRSELSEKERLALDAYYTVTRTFLGDMAILFKTFPALIFRRGAR